MEIPDRIQKNLYMLDLWDKTHDELKEQGVIEEIDFKTLERFVILSFEIYEIERRINSETNNTLFVFNENTNMSDVHPLTRPLNEKQRLLQSVMDSLLMNPKARKTALKKAEENIQVDKFEKYRFLGQ